MKRILSLLLVLSLLASIAVFVNSISYAFAEPPVTGEENPTTGEENPTTGEENPTTGEENPTTGEENPTTGEENPTTGEENPSTGEENPTTGEENPTTGEENPTTGEENPTTGEENPTTGEENPSTGEENPTTGEENPTTGEENPATGEENPTTGEENPTTGEENPTTGEEHVHEWETEWTIDIEPTQETDGEKSHHCTGCDERKDITKIPALYHVWDDGTIIKDPTCTVKGEIEYHCVDCDETYIDEIDALGHNFSPLWKIDIPPECTEPGERSHHCSRCDARTDIEPISPTGHFWDDGTVTVEPTCTEKGKLTYCCTECDASIVQDIDPLGHDYVFKEVEGGFKIYECTRCHTTRREKIQGVVSLRGTDFSTAWGLDFEYVIYGTQVSGEGGSFRLTVDPLAASVRSVTAAPDVVAAVDGGVITVSFAGEIDPDTKLVTLALTTSDELVPGRHDFIRTDVPNSFGQMVIYEMGDVNMDGVINSRDATMAKQAAVKLIKLTDAQQIYANVYADNAVNSRDAVLITQKVVRMKVTLGDRIDVIFTGLDGGELVRSVRKGNSLKTVPEAPEGYRWSSLPTVYFAPSFENITVTKRFYLIK